MNKPNLRGLIFIQNGFKIIALLLVLMGVSGLQMGVPLGEISRQNAITELITLGVLAVFLFYLSCQFIKLRKWAYYVTLIFAIIISVLFTFRIVHDLIFNDFKLGGSSASAFSIPVLILPTIFFYFTVYYLMRTEVKAEFK